MIQNFVLVCMLLIMQVLYQLLTADFLSLNLANARNLDETASVENRLSEDGIDCHHHNRHQYCTYL